MTTQTSLEEYFINDIDELTSAQEELDKDVDELTSVQEELDEEVDLISKDTNLSKTKLRKSNISERTDRFTIQITSKKMLKDAQLFSNELIKRGYDAYIQKVLFKSNETFYRVRVGSYDNYNSAKIAAKSLSKDLKMTTWVDFVRKEQ